MIRSPRYRRLGFALLALAFAGATWRVGTHAVRPRDPRQVTLRLAHWQLEGGIREAFEAIARDYESLHPGVTIEQIPVPVGIYASWGTTQIIGGAAPDLVEIKGGMGGPELWSYFRPITEEVAKPNPYNKGTPQEKIPWQDTFHDKLLAPKRDSPDPGQIYGVNITETTLRLFCNVELMKEILGRVVVPKNFDDLRKILAEVKQYSRRTGRTISGLAGSRDTTRAVAESVFVAPLMGVNQRLDDEGILYRYNRQMLAAYLAGRWRYNDPAVLAGLQLVRETTDSMKPGFIQLRRDDAMIEFLRGQALFFFYGTWDATSLRQLAPFKIQPMKLMQAMPDDPEVGKFVVAQGGEGIGETSLSMYLNKASRHRAEALDFLQFLTSVPGQQRFTDASLWLPAVNGVTVPEEIRNFRDYQEGISFGQAPYDALGTEVGMHWDRNFYLLVGDQGSVEKFAAAMDAAMPAAMRTDLEAELRATLVLVKPQDPAIVGWAGLAGDKARTRREESEASQTMSEGLALQMKLQLETTK